MTTRPRTTLLCPLCTDDRCVCREELLGAPDDELDVASAWIAELDDDQRVAAAAVDPVAGIPDAGGGVERAQVIAVKVDEAEGRHEWTLREVPPQKTPACWILTGGPCAGEYDAMSPWPPRQQIRAVVNADGRSAVLDLDEDEPLLDEQVVVYQLAGHGFMCGPANPSGLYASYYPAGFSERDRMDVDRALLGWERLPA